MEKTIVRCNEAPSPVGPYSQGVILDGWVWTSCWLFRRPHRPRAGSVSYQAAVAVSRCGREHLASALERRGHMQTVLD